MLPSICTLGLSSPLPAYLQPFLSLPLHSQGKRKKGIEREGGGEQKHKESCNLFTFLSSTVWKCRTLAGFVGYGQSMHCKASCCLLACLGGSISTRSLSFPSFFIGQKKLTSTWWWNDFSVNQITHSSKVWSLSMSQKKNGFNPPVSQIGERE